jgi:hypothetical protein
VQRWVGSSGHQAAQRAIGQHRRRQAGQQRIQTCGPGDGISADGVDHHRRGGADDDLAGGGDLGCRAGIAHHVGGTNHAGRQLDDPPAGLLSNTHL